MNGWMKEIEKKIIISLLNKEVSAHGLKQGMYLDDKSGRLYYPAFGEYRSEPWPTRYKGIQTKQVAKLMWAEQLKQKIYVHTAVKPTITKLHRQFYLRLNPTMVITDDGIHVRKDSRSGTVITRSSYNQYNKSLLNDILFWISKLGDGKDLYIVNDFVILSEPVQTTINTGINWDIPTSDLKKFIDEYDTQTNDEDEE